jgi:hypothetical protein
VVFTTTPSVSKIGFTFEELLLTSCSHHHWPEVEERAPGSQRRVPSQGG